MKIIIQDDCPDLLYIKVGLYTLVKNNTNSPIIIQNKKEHRPMGINRLTFIPIGNAPYIVMFCI